MTSASTLSDPRRCVVIVSAGRVVDPACEAALSELARREYRVWRARADDPPPSARDRMVGDALAHGYEELLLLDPEVMFNPDDVDRLRGLGMPFVCGLYPEIARRALACEFTPETTAIPFGRSGVLIEVVAAALGFALVRRDVFEAMRPRLPTGAGGLVPYFAPAPGAAGRAGADHTFCDRARACGFTLMADTRIRLWRVGPYWYGWEEAGREPERYAEYLFHAPQPERRPTAPSGDVVRVAPFHPPPPRNPLRGKAEPLPPAFPNIGAYLFSYPANRDSFELTLASVRASDWGEEPTVLMQPDDWPAGRDNGSRNFKRAMEAAVADGCDYALILEDDVRVGRHLRHNLLSIPLVRRDQCDYLSLFVPDLLADPWERIESHLGYRLAKPRYSGPNRLWERSRVWGSQGYLLSRRLMLAAIDRWDRLREGQDTRVLSVCAEFGLPLWYTAPSLVEHAPLVSAFGTPSAYAPDFDPDVRFEIRPGFQPPEQVPGWLTLPEAELLWRSAKDRDVLELGTAGGRSTVCLAQSARRVVTIDREDQAEAIEWVRRYGLAERTTFHRGDVGQICMRLTDRFGLVFIDTLHDAASVTRDIEAALRLLEPSGRLAFHDYPDPGWPDVRRVVDSYAGRLGWKRIAQAGFAGVFQT